MCNPFPYILYYVVTNVIIVACLCMHICTSVLNLVSISSGTTIPISFNISMEMFLLFFSVTSEDS